MVVQLNTRIEKNLSTSTMNKIFCLSPKWYLFATSHEKGPADGIGGPMKRLAAKASLQRMYNNKIQTLMNYSITAAAIYTTLHSFMSKKNKFLTKRRSLQNDLILHLQYQEIELITVSSH
jgi:hypothetical protein